MVTGPGPESPARRYREVTQGMTEAVARMRNADAELVRQLTARLAGLQAAITDAETRELLTVLSASVIWQDALDELRNEHWLPLSRLPKPDPRAKPLDLDNLDAVVERRYEALCEVLRRRALLGRR
jgi:hypothetical protein